MLLTGILSNPSTNQHKHELRKVWPQAQMSSDCVIQTVCKMDKLFQKVGSRTRKGRKNGRIYEMCLLFASYFL